MAEIEHFVHPLKKEHPRFHTVANNVLPLFPKTNQARRRDIVAACCR